MGRSCEVTREQAQMLYEVGIKGYITENQTALAERMLERMKEEELPVEQELYRFWARNFWGFGCRCRKSS